ncbi:hypothetical protein CRE_29468 [Caenorhabditis remanei]|uniref:Uncharacterized protein n=1 Tax=Caenorhabditis remanei TaxID=31234 RepID=E3LV58_CAERE|nr:hypothetical protein CRE_29468 [Caenorhabditis remanei]
MGACDKADLSQKVMCCAGKVQVIILAGIFFLAGIASAGLIYWQISTFQTIIPDKDVSSMYILMMLPGLMVLSALCLFAMLGINPKMLLVICIVWPVLTAAVAGGLIYFCYYLVEYSQKEGNHPGMSKKELLKTFEDHGIYIFYVVPAGAAMHIILAIYCIVLLVCLACCQRGGAGRDEDLYSLEENEEADGIESSTKSHISIE